MENFVLFSNACSIFRAHALQSEPNKAGNTKFVKFKFQSKSSKIERAYFFGHFSLTFIKNISYLKSSLNLGDEYHFHLSMTAIKVVRKLIFQKILTSHETNQLFFFCLFYKHDPKPKPNHQIASSRAKTKFRQSHTCVKYRGIIICIKINTYYNTSDLKYFTNFFPNKVDFPDVSPNIHVVCLQPNA